MVSADVETLDIARHEVAHIVTREATKGPFGIAGWLNEGHLRLLADAPLAGHDSALAAAITRDRVLSMTAAELVGDRRAPATPSASSTARRARS